MDIQTGWCLVDGRKAYIRKINENGIVCYIIMGQGQRCEKIEDFKNRKIQIKKR